MSQRFNSIPEGIMDFIPPNKYATLQQLQLQSNCDFRWLCDTLIQTYNTSVLDVSDTTFKDACIEQAHKCVREENRTSERTVLSQLIINHSKENDSTVLKKDKKPIADFIGGPSTLTMHWSKQYKKLIYIFGEKHTEKTDCRNFYSKKDQDKEMLIEDYLEQLFKNTDAFIDFYLETERTYQDIYGDTRMAVMAKRFKDCFHNPNTKENENTCKLSRMHYFDVRRESSDIKINSMTYASLSMKRIYMKFVGMHQTQITLRDILTIFSDLLEHYDYDTKIKPVLEEFSKINFYDEEEDDDIKYKEYDEFWDKQIKEEIFVLKKVDRSTIHNIIKSFIKKELRNPHFHSKKDFRNHYKDSTKVDIKTLVKTVKDFLAKLNKFSTGTTNKYNFESIRKDDITILLNLEFSVWLMMCNALVTTDYYLLGRIFKVFDFTKKRRLTDEPKKPHNIIIYAGDVHSATIRKFLKELEFRDISHVNPESYVSNCINMHGFPQPFFSNHRKIKWSDKLLDEFVVDEEIVDLERAAKEAKEAEEDDLYG